MIVTTFTIYIRYLEDTAQQSIFIAEKLKDSQKLKRSNPHVNRSPSTKKTDTTGQAEILYRQEHKKRLCSTYPTIKQFIRKNCEVYKKKLSAARAQLVTISQPL